MTELQKPKLPQTQKPRQASAPAPMPVGSPAALSNEEMGMADYCNDPSSGRQDRARGEARAWNQVATQWHRQRGLPIRDDFCAGCDLPLDGAPEVALFPSRQRAHADNGFDCIRRYVARWEAEAATALAAIGIPTQGDRL